MQSVQLVDLMQNSTLKTAINSSHAPRLDTKRCIPQIGKSPAAIFAVLRRPTNADFSPWHPPPAAASIFDARLASIW
jgi:hypothetical protein